MPPSLDVPKFLALVAAIAASGCGAAQPQADQPEQGLEVSPVATVIVPATTEPAPPKPPVPEKAPEVVAERPEEPEPTEEGASFGVLGLLGGPDVEGLGFGGVVGSGIGGLGSSSTGSWSMGPSAPRTNPPRVTFQQPVVTGQLPPEIVRRILRASAGRSRLCYETALKRNPKLTGTIRTRIVINNQGAVTSATNAGSDVPDAALINCVVQAHRSLSFPQPKAGVVTAVQPILFQPPVPVATAPPPATAPPTKKPPGARPPGAIIKGP